MVKGSKDVWTLAEIDTHLHPPSYLSSLFLAGMHSHSVLFGWKIQALCILLQVYHISLFLQQAKCIRTLICEENTETLLVSIQSSLSLSLCFLVGIIGFLYQLPQYTFWRYKICSGTMEQENANNIAIITISWRLKPSMFVLVNYMYADEAHQSDIMNDT